MSRPRNPNGVRRAHTRNGKPVRAGSIKGRQAPKRRLNASARRRVQRKPMLYAAGTLAGLGALDAILTGRWGGAIVLGSLAGGFLLGHLVWSHHQNRQARKPAKPKPTRPAPQQRREALEKARAAHQPAPAAPKAESVRPQQTELNRTNGASNGNAPTSHEEWQTLNGKQCDCTKCRAKRKAEKAEKVSLR